MSVERPVFLSFLLRLWAEPHNGTLIWRASLESVQTGEIQKFATVTQYIEYLENTFKNEDIESGE